MFAFGFKSANCHHVLEQVASSRKEGQVADLQFYLWKNLVAYQYSAYLSEDMTRKKAIITGAASGLGREFCRLLASDSHDSDTCDLVLVDRDEDGLRNTARMVTEACGRPAEMIVMDLGVDGAAGELFRQVEGQDLDILINCAGFGLFGFFVETDWQMEQSMLYLHVLNLTHLTKLVAQQMVDRGQGRILNVSSLAAFQPGPLMNIYYASKAYIHYFSEALANELKGTGVTVTVLLPGLFNSNFTRSAARYSGSGERSEKMVTTTVEQVARVALKGMMKGRIRVIPGFSNKLLALAPRLLPRNFVLSTLRRLQERIREKEAP